MLDNSLVLLFIVATTITAKEERQIGYMVAAYYIVYILLDNSQFPGIMDVVLRDFSNAAGFYIMFMSLSCFFSVWASYIYMNQGGAVWLYSAWLILDALLCSFLALSQSFETNALLFVYNVLQNINLYADIIIVVIGTDNVLKRNSKSAARIIDGFNMRSERWLDMVFISSIKSAPKCKKKSTT